MMGQAKILAVDDEPDFEALLNGSNLAVKSALATMPFASPATVRRL